MAITTYDELQTAIASWLARSDLTSNIPDFITLFEAWVNRNLRVREMETVLSFTTTDGSRNLPDDYLAWRRMTFEGSTQIALEYVTPDMLTRFTPNADDGTPRIFTIEGGTIRVRPVDDDTDLTFTYYAKVPVLADETDGTNWLLDAHPDLYLAGSLVEANAFLLNPEHAQLWATKRDMIVDEIARLSEKTKGPSAIRPVGPVF